jgi:APA family basic amino acid/polyamine antiporter
MAHAATTTKIGLTTAIIVCMNAMIGSGIFTAPAAMASNVGPAGILAYVIVIAAVWFIALSLSRLAQLYPEEGSFYTYAQKWGGHYAGLAASGLYLTGLVIAMSLLSQMVGLYAQKILPSISATTIGFGSIVALTILNLFGVILSEVGQYILIALTLFPLIAITIFCFMKANIKNLTPFAPYGFGNVFKATRMVIFGFFGFESAASLFSIVANPKRNVPLALTISILCVGFTYMLFVFSIILAIPLSSFGGAQEALTSTLSRVFPGNEWLVSFIHIAILSAIIGTIHSMIWGASELLVSLVHKIKRQSMSYQHQTYQRIAVCFIGGCIALSFFLFKNLNLFFSCTALCIVSSYILSMITLLTLKDEWKSGQNIKTLLGILTACFIIYVAAQAIVQEFQIS